MSITAPTDIGSCILWLDARLGITLDGSSRVSVWGDQTSHANDFHQTTAGNRPEIASADYNGHDVVKFNPAVGTGGRTYLDGPNLYNGATAGEIFYLLKNAADPPAASNDTGLHHFSSSTDHYTWTDGVIYDGWGSSARQTVGNPTPDLASTYRVYNITSKSGEWTARLDGTQLYTTASNTPNWNTAPLIGNDNSLNYNGKIAAVYAFNAGLTTTERSDMMAYISSSWAGSVASSGPVFRVSGFIG